MPTTYRDIADTLLQISGANAIAGNMGMVRGAIHEALRTLGNDLSAKYLVREDSLNLNASYSTGSIAYDATGGSNERQVTLTTGTWPTWAAAGRILISDVPYEVDRRISDSIITLDDRNCPDEDVASGTSYTLYQNIYPLPADFLTHRHAVLRSNSCELCWIDPPDWAHLSRRDTGLSTPTRFTIMGDPDNLTRLALFIHPAPSADDAIHLLYNRRPQSLVYSGHDAAVDCAGKITTTASSTTVAGSGTAFESGMVGSILRVGRDATNVPTGLDGPTPYKEELQIKSVTNATTLVLEAAATYSSSNVKYCVSDPIDLEPAMLTAFLRGCELAFERRRNGKQVALKQAEYLMALRMAKAADHRTTQRQYAGEGTGRSYWQRGAVVPEAGDWS